MCVSLVVVVCVYVCVCPWWFVYVCLSASLVRDEMRRDSRVSRWVAVTQ